MKTIVFFLEEPSTREMLKGILPRIVPQRINIRYVVFQGKQDLEKNLKQKLRGWMSPDSFFVVIRDQDSGDCKAIKNKLIQLCRKAGKNEVLIRIACRELESFYLGDLAAVEKGLNLRGLKSKQQGKKFRNPDVLANPAGELFRITSNAYDKVSGSRAIAPYLNLESNCSMSFNMLLSGIKSILKHKH